MNVTLAYLGRSGLHAAGDARVLQLEPNLARAPVAFDAPLRRPLRFREAVSALHDVVVSDLRFKKRDKTTYLKWKQDEGRRLAQLRQGEFDKARDEILARQSQPVPRDLQAQFDRGLKRYWDARRAYDQYLRRNDPELWRMIMPYDPVITVADDVVFFECFSADESSYGCLSVARDDGFGPADSVSPGTTNVDYSWQLYGHFQSLRSYRETRFRIDPAGFEVATGGAAEGYREEKIDLPTSWLRGFMQIQGAMGMPMRRVTLGAGAVYSLLAWLKRHRARTSPRALRFELLDGRPPRLVLEPWEQEVVSHDTVYRGPDSEPIRIWGRGRLVVLARALPLADRIDVFLLGTGLPSFWVVRMGEMTLTVGLSGWTKADWTRGTSLDLLAPPEQPRDAVIDAVAGLLSERRAARFDQIERAAAAPAPAVAAALNYLAHAGQVICDLPAGGLYRWRQVMPMALGELEIGPPDPELTASRQLVRSKRVRVGRTAQAPRGGRLISGAVERHEVEVLLDGDDVIRRGKCNCSHHFRFGIRKGPCRHLLALRQVAMGGAGGEPESADSWYARMKRWAGG